MRIMLSWWFVCDDLWCNGTEMAFIASNVTAPKTPPWIGCGSIASASTVAGAGNETRNINIGIYHSLNYHADGYADKVMAATAVIILHINTANSTHKCFFFIMVTMSKTTSSLDYLIILMYLTGKTGADSGRFWTLFYYFRLLVLRVGYCQMVTILFSWSMCTIIREIVSILEKTPGISC